MAKHMLTVHLGRKTTSTPWGFSLTGGPDQEYFLLQSFLTVNTEFLGLKVNNKNDFKNERAIRFFKKDMWTLLFLFELELSLKMRLNLVDSEDLI